MNKVLAAGMALMLLFICFSSVSADKPTPGASTPGDSGREPPGQVKKTPDAAAASLDQKGNGRHAVFGTVSVVTPTGFTIGVQPNAWVITVSNITKFRFPGKKNASLADLAVGDRVAVNGTPIAGGLDAKQVAVAPGKPTVQHRVGKVTEYSPGSSLKILTVQGESETFALTPQTVIRNAKGSGLNVGDQVTVVSHREPATDIFTATGIVVH